ncbi:hypothetical protein [Geitlerinema sp. PCC 9228]|uniref:hypothetical protein n=1 Tax=Geitlerinema sp. PCC 9228 TaxID=111611 RepID=UPI001B8BBD7A|nr:hypothetical protein [Geitlerinema sp. PCC 9228]
MFVWMLLAFERLVGGRAIAEQPVRPSYGTSVLPKLRHGNLVPAPRSDRFGVVFPWPSNKPSGLGDGCGSVPNPFSYR